MIHCSHVTSDPFDVYCIFHTFSGKWTERLYILDLSPKGEPSGKFTSWGPADSSVVTARLLMQVKC